MSATGICPEDTLVCAVPDCIILSTTTVPNGEVKGAVPHRQLRKRESAKGIVMVGVGSSGLLRQPLLGDDR